MGEEIVYIEGVGYCKEIVISRVNESGISESYVVYEPIE